MAEFDGEKSQEPTQHRRQQARQEGQIAKSQDLGSAALLVLGLVALMMVGDDIVRYLVNLTHQQLGGAAWLSADLDFAVAQWNATVTSLSWTVLPLLGLLTLLALVVDVGQIGFLFLPERAMPDVSRLDPLRGLQRIFSLSGVIRLAFGIIKIAIISSVALVSLYHERETILGMTAMTVPQIALYLTQLLVWTALKIGAALLVLAILDYGFQRWKLEQDLRMTPQEVREEMKNLEGNPQVISRRKAVQRQLAAHRLSGAVPKADVVVTNPTELAIAIQYDPETMAAPIVVAKGAGVIAQRIRELALENGIPIIERKPLAQALFREVEINHPIPKDKYAAVAEVLAYVYQLKGKKIPNPGR